MRKSIIAIAAASALVLGACGSDDQGGRVSEEDTAEQQLTQFLEAQPIPIFEYSQLRQNLIEIETAQANATVTTSFFFNQGVVDPIHSCPSIGFPIPGTFQLTNPQQVIGRESRVAIPQLEANGVYTGDTTATTVICIDADGRGYASYWEGFVSTVAGPAEWDATTKTVVLTGAPTAEFSTGEE
jgi:hypothetical protein